MQQPAMRRRQRPQEVGEVVGNGMKLKPHRVCGKCPARQPRPPDRALAFLDPLLARPALVIERNDPLAVRLMFVTMKPTRGYSSPGCHSTVFRCRHEYPIWAG